MRWLTKTIIGLAYALLAVLALLAIVVFALDERQHRWLLTQAVGAFTPYELAIDGPLTLSLSMEPELSASEIRIKKKGADPSTMQVAIGSVYTTIALKQLLDGTVLIRRLAVADADISIRTGVPSPEDKTESPRNIGPDMFIPVVKNASLKRINVTVFDPKSERSIRGRLSELEVKSETHAEPLAVDGTGELNEVAFSITGGLGSMDEALNPDSEFPVRLNIALANAGLSVTGAVRDPLRGEGITLRIDGEAEELADILTLMALDTPRLGRATLSAVLEGNIEAPAVRDLEIVLSNPPRLAFSARGSAANAWTGEGARGEISLSCTDADLLHPHLADGLPPIEGIELTARIHGTNGDLSLEDVLLTLGGKQGLTLTADGWLQVGGLPDSPRLRELRLALDLNAAATEALRPLIFDWIPEMAPFSGAAVLVGTDDHLAMEQIELNLGQTDAMGLQVRGRIDRLPVFADGKLAGLDLSLVIAADEIKRLLAAFEPHIPDLGQASATGHLAGDADRLELSDVRINTASSAGLVTEAAGSMRFVLTGDAPPIEAMDLALRASAPSLGALEPVIGKNRFSKIGPLTVEGQLKGAAKWAALENLSLVAGDPRNYRIEWNGRVGKIPLTADGSVAEVDVRGTIQSPGLAELSPVAGVDLPATGPLSGACRINDRNGVLGITDIDVLLGDADSAHMRATGSIDSVFRGTTPVWDDVAVKIALQAISARALAGLGGLAVPEIGTVSGALHVTGGPEKLSVEDTRLTLSSKTGFTVQAEGGIGHLGLTGKPRFKNIRIRIEASAPGPAAVPYLEELSLPDIGPLDFLATVRDQSGMLDVETFTLRAGTGKHPMLVIDGRADRIGGEEPINLSARIESRVQPWLQALLPGLSAGRTAEGTLQGRAEISGTADRIDIRRLDLEASGPAPFKMAVSGALTPATGLPETDITIRFETSDPAAIASLAGVSRPLAGPLRLDGNLRSNEKQVLFDGKTVIGRNRFDVSIQRIPADASAKWIAAVKAPAAYLDDLGFFPEPDSVTPTPSTPKPAKTHIFDDTPLPFDSLKQIDIDLDLDVERLVGKNVALNHLDLDLELQDGRLHVKLDRLLHADGFITIDTRASAAGKSPEIALQLTAEDIAIGGVLSYLNATTFMDGQFTLALDVKSTGRSWREIASGLNGDMGFAIENGTIRREANLMSADAFAFLMSLSPRKDPYSQLNCMAARVNFENGLGTSEVMFLDTPNLTARGLLKLNLADETIDLVIQPKPKKRRLTGSSPIRVTGSLASPSVRKLPFREAAQLYGEIVAPMLFLPARALGYLWHLLKDDKQQTPCLLKAIPEEQ